MLSHIGIDFGAKMAGTTAICYSESDTLKLLQSAKKQDADRFILDFVFERQPRQIFIDAPLSLPLVYTQAEQEEDYFYRASDRELGAMSPMFLGGLSARAMRLKALIEKSGIRCFETYPAAFVKKMLIGDHEYKKDIEVFKYYCKCKWNDNLILPATMDNWHQIDAFLAWWSGHRHQSGQTLSFGNTVEGTIII